jgi:hypothetical protein
MQALLKNPLADPFLLGTSGERRPERPWPRSPACRRCCRRRRPSAGAVLPRSASPRSRRRGGRLDLQRLLLAGLIANAFFSALLLLVFSVAPAKPRGRCSSG